MMNANVGAGIISIITESLYDKPIVVFREYVQNSVDSFVKSGGDQSEYVVEFWKDKQNLYFLDNGNGIEYDKFESVMLNIGTSDKVRTIDIGYKGIGRLSGLPYCSTLIFVNICSYRECKFQVFSIDGQKYEQIKRQGESGLLFSQMMNEIGTYAYELHGTNSSIVNSKLQKHKGMFDKRDKGFLVILEDINYILNATIDSGNFNSSLSWLLPVKFKKELTAKKDGIKALFDDFTNPSSATNVIPARAFNIVYDGKQLERPIGRETLRKYNCKSSFGKYAVGFHTFNQDKIQIIKNNELSGIRLYIDNMLLCDETELIPILYQYGLIKHSVNELIQTVKGIGAIIYIIDKNSITANARRTFFEVTDADALNLLELLAVFIENIYLARYALSRYSTIKNTFDHSEEKLEQSKQEAISALQRLAVEDVGASFEESTITSFTNLDQDAQKKVMKKKLILYMNHKIKEYLEQASTLNYERGEQDFLTWFKSNHE